MFRRRPTGYLLIAICLDLVGIVVTLDVSRQLRDYLPFGKLIPVPVAIPFVVMALTALIWFVVLMLFNVYDPRRSDSLIGELQNVVTGSLFALLAMAGALYFSFRDVSRLFIVYFYILTVMYLIGWRVIGRLVWLAMGGKVKRPPYRVLIVGAGELGQQAASLLQEDGEQVLGYVDAHHATAAGNNLPYLGMLEDAAAIVRSQRVDHVIITLPYQAYDQLEGLILSLQKLPVQISIAPNYLNLVLHQATVQDVGGLPLVHLRDPALSPSQRLIKRGFDVVIGTLSIIVSAPLMLIIMTAIRLDSSGSIIFRQKRVGENGRLFTMYKFRTMIEGAEQQIVTSPTYSSDGHVIHKREDDPRITRLGFFLRRTSLDELPQLINVLKGDMSLVGPRPEMPWLVDKYEPWQHKRFAIPQGMTGWWQINGRSDKPMHLHTEDDLYYIQHYSLLFDLVILWRTIFAVLKRKGAY
ncbi:MAG: sugar transferase [Anaerolineae bacterium]|nr:sugar transferase [Anaerolineae bacterium]